VAARAKHDRLFAVVSAGVAVDVLLVGIGLCAGATGSDIVFGSRVGEGPKARRRRLRAKRARLLSLKRRRFGEARIRSHGANRRILRLGSRTEGDCVLKRNQIFLVVVFMDDNRLRASSRGINDLSKATDGTTAIVSFHGEVGERITTASFGRDVMDFCQAEDLEGFLVARDVLESSLPIEDESLITGEIIVDVFVKQG
jgi:hypothetical protein